MIVHLMDFGFIVAADDHVGQDDVELIIVEFLFQCLQPDSEE